jgi:hypothetical protein
VFGPKGDEMTGGWRILLTEKCLIFLFNMYYEDCQIKEDGVGEACSVHEGDEKYI